MTRQMQNRFEFRDADYSVIDYSERELFHPSMLGLKPYGMSTACRAGYHAVYGLANSRLIVRSMSINLYDFSEGPRPELGPPINGVKPRPGDEYDHFNNYYIDILHPVKYTGGILLAEGLQRTRHDIIDYPWNYKTVIELIFERGILTSEFDRSKGMAEISTIVSSLSREDLYQKTTSKQINEIYATMFDRKYSAPLLVFQ